MEEERDLPRGVCRACAEGAVAAGRFRALCLHSSCQWERAAEALADLEDATPDDKCYYVFYSDTVCSTIKDQREGEATTRAALGRLNSTFGFPGEMRKQRQSHKRKPCVCPDCGKFFQFPYYLDIHLKKTNRRACIECALIVGKEDLPGHLASVHGKEVSGCVVCHKLFDDPFAMRQHVVGSHDNCDLRLCSACNASFANERALRAHMYAHTLFCCQNCSKCFENRKCFVYHQTKCKVLPKRSNSDEGVFTCDYCQHSYTKKPSLRIHIIQKHLNVLPYQCETCGKRTSTLGHLRSHEAIHKVQRRIFQCFCGNKLRTELGFQLHQRIHTGEKPYECEECGERFLSASRRLDHVKRRHRSTKDMPHGCTKCHARFVRPSELRKHYQVIHDSDIDVSPVKRRPRVHVKHSKVTHDSRHLLMHKSESIPTD